MSHCQFIQTKSFTFQSALKELFSTCHQFLSCNTQMLCTGAKFASFIVFSDHIHLLLQQFASQCW